MEFKIVVIVLLLQCVIRVTHAQDILPGQQAQGYLDANHSSVDYSTGIFHYKLPLYTLRSGDFQLPLSLDYASRGVKVDDVPGRVGYNWLLNAGGVVTRTIRGGIADEELEIGYLWSSATLLEDGFKRVNKREQDGESDIFTVVYNGKTLHFIIRLDADKRIYAEPLERTNARIKCSLSGNGRWINSWTITDEAGNRYFYGCSEMTQDINSEGAISRNGIRNKMYLSSWYLSRIEPLNGDPIIFSYEGNVKTEHRTFCSTRYWYHRPVMERSFDFSKYEAGFQQELALARGYLGRFSLEAQVDNAFYQYVSYGNWIRNPWFKINQQTIWNNFKVMGMLSDIQRVNAASQDLIHLLNNLENSYKQQSSANARAAASCFSRAKSLVIRSIEDVAPVTTKEAGEVVSYTVISPLLKKIRCADKVVSFDYFGGQSVLSSISLKGVFGNQESKIELYNNAGVLYSVSFLDKNNEVVGKTRFGYYPLLGGNDHDVWGYRKRVSDDGERFSTDVDIESTKSCSLKTITFLNGGRLVIDYESNRAEHLYDTPQDKINVTIGGLRVKSLAFEERQGGKVDSILYSYPLPGKLVYDSYSNTEIVYYEGFNDIVRRSRVTSTGNAFLNLGNNGVFYPYVQETIPGKGIKTFLFHVPSVYCYWKMNPYPYPFWLNGLPLASAEYDENKNLKRLVKNKYYTDCSFMGYLGNPYSGENDYYFESHPDSAWQYRRALRQMKPYEFYLDREEQADFYRRQGSIFLYEDNGRRYTCNPYEEVFLPNVEPRTHVKLPRQDYFLIYGGKTLLKEQAEYCFEGAVTNGVSLDHFAELGTGTPYRAMEFHYDHLVGTILPTRESSRDCRGNTITRVFTRVTEMSEAVFPFIARMKRANFLSPLIKEATLINGKLIDETVSRYEVFETDSTCHFGLADRFVRVPDSPVVYTPSIPDRVLFTGGESNYREISSWKHERLNNFCLPVEVLTCSTRVANVYDPSGRYVVLRAENVSPRHVAAIDRNRYRASVAFSEEVGQNIRLQGVCDTFIKGYKQIRGIDCGMEYLRYVQTQEHRLMINVISTLASGKSPVNTREFQGWLDSVRMNDNGFIRDFAYRYTIFLQEPIFNTISRDDYRFLFESICAPGVVNLTFFEKLIRVFPGEFFSLPDAIRVTSIPDSKRVKLFVLSKGPGGTVSYSVTHAGGTSAGVLTLNSSPGHVLQDFEIDLGQYSGASSVVVNVPPVVTHAVVVPSEALFEAVSYHLDGSVFCRYNQGGQLELNEYDAAGRLERVKDKEGNLLKEYRYNAVK